MFDYTAEQKTLEIGGVRIGGPSGRIPTVLIPSIFYTKDRLVKNADLGEINKPATENLLNMLADLTEKTGLGTMLDVVATTSEAMENYLQYLIDNTDFPLLIDGSDSLEVNTAGIRTAKEGGFLDRVIINSLTPDTNDELYNVVKDTGLTNAILLTFNSASLASSSKRVEVADILIQRAQAAGISSIMIDTGVMDLPTLGIACKTQHLLKGKYGYPVGNGAHNAISTWVGLVPKFGKDAKKPAMVGSSLMPVSLGADFVLMGPAKDAPLVYPSVAMIDVALSGILIEDRIRPDKPHPRYLIS
ncbi:MAG: tetrahydromethanopterin S-methyltransferase subunit H [Candidatus Thorarchaeota archaeon]|nr:MAG: tetrahydromethanopterin S-methyltransferase subunit H [Candidatus Thorarchaeota archaeon]